MARTYRHTEDDDDDPFDERGVLRDGRTVRVSMMDAVSARDPARRHLHDGRGGAPGHRPGFAFTRDEYAKDELEVAYYEYERSIADAWRNPPTGEGERGPIGAREGDLCTIDGAPGHLDGGLVCIPDAPMRNATRADHAAIMDREYERYDAELREKFKE